MKPAPDYLRAVFNRLERLIEDRWEVPVRIQDVPNPFTGDLDGELLPAPGDPRIPPDPVAEPDPRNCRLIALRATIRAE